jgi:DNA-binding beta-propeller fold protein YncE
VALRLLGQVELPAHVTPGGFDHADVHQGTGRLYVAHTANDALDVIDCASDRYLHSIPNLTGVAGALASDERNLIFTSNRAENTVGIFSADDEAALVKVGVGVRPNGLAYDPGRNVLLAAHVGDPAIPGSFTVSLIGIERKQRIADIAVPGRTRWAIFDPHTSSFYVNISDPAVIVVIDAAQPAQVTKVLPVPVAGPHGLDLDLARRRLFCACDGKKLVVLAMDGSVQATLDISGVPDVIFFNAALKHLYVAIGDPGVIDVFDTASLKLIETVATGRGAHTLGYDRQRNKVYAFLPQSHSAAVYADRA